MISVTVVAPILGPAPAVGAAAGAAGAASFLGPEPLCTSDRLDLMILLDASGSMGPEIAELRNGLSGLLADLSLHYDVHVGLVVFGHLLNGDPDNQSPVRVDGLLNTNVTVPLGADATPVQGLLDLLAGNGQWEPWGDGIDILNHDVAWRPGALRIGLIATDEPVNEGRRIPGPLSRTSGSYFDGPELHAATDLAASNGIRLVGIDTAGGGLVKTQLQTAAAKTSGAYAHLPHGSGDLVATVKSLILAISSEAYRSASAAGLVNHVNVPANPVLTVAPSASLEAPATSPAAEDRERLIRVPVPASAGGGHVTVLESRAAHAGTASALHARATANASRVLLLGGMVEVGAVHVDVRADRATGVPGTAVNDQSFLADVRVGTLHIPLVTTPQSIPIAGIGTLHLLYTVERSPGAQDPAIHMEGIRLETRTASARTVLSVAVAEAAVGCMPVKPPLMPWRDDDAGQGGDAGASPGNAYPIAAPALVAGRLGAGSDTVDAYRFHSKGPGESISLTVTPATRADTVLTEIPASAPALPAYATSSTTVDLPSLAVDLLDPTGTVVETRSETGGVPVHLEFNPHVAGSWTARVRLLTPGIANYSLALSAPPLVVLPQDGTLSGIDLPDGCGSGPVIDPGVYSGTLHGADFADAVRLDLVAGDALVITMKASENVDGADFGIRLYEPGCGTPPRVGITAGPDGAPHVIAASSVPVSGLYTLVVVRESLAVGNYHLGIAKAAV